MRSRRCQNRCHARGWSELICGILDSVIAALQLTPELSRAYDIRSNIGFDKISVGRDLCWANCIKSQQVLGSKHMDKKKLETFKKKLETRRQELSHMVVRNQKDGRTADEEATQDVADRAASSYNKEFLFSQSNNDRQLLNMVDGALARIREGSFGECVSCGKEINAKRLDAVPWTRHCIECQEKAEQGLLETAQ
jgi:DnaK suppressor protein